MVLVVKVVFIGGIGGIGGGIRCPAEIGTAGNYANFNSDQKI